METVNDKLSIKNILFCKAIPNYVIPIPTTGHNIFGCIDCGDRFILECSYESHLNRKSLKISYMCRHCGQLKIFYNRCNLLSHIRSHAFKTATINVTDLNIEPLPITSFNLALLNKSDTSSQQTAQLDVTLKSKPKTNYCHECIKPITDTGTLYKDRAKHYMQYTNTIYSCPICMFALPTPCGLKAHLRIHLKAPPFYCPECGIHLVNKCISYPYNHDCEGFRMMRATARIKCPVGKCHLLHPSEFKEHFVNNHLKKVFKCPYCFVACFDEQIMKKHIKSHESESKICVFYQCEMCPGRLVLTSQIDNHLKSHANCNRPSCHPCWSCGTVFRCASSLISHHLDKHGLQYDLVKNLINSVLNAKDTAKLKKIYRVVKRCDQCLRSFTYKCQFEEIKKLPNECPYKCTNVSSSQTSSVDIDSHIICRMCKNKLPCNWESIKIHYANRHKEHRCLDVKVILTKLNISKLRKNLTLSRVKRQKETVKFPNSGKNRISKRNRKQKKEFQQTVRTVPIQNVVELATTSQNNDVDGYHCNKCEHVSETKELLEEHLISHRDPCMAYQCMDCGQSFVVKPSFSTHLLVEHGVADVEGYIKKYKQCYNQNALNKVVQDTVIDEPLNENQCNICREQFDNSDDLQKHFRVHGMAFLLKNNPVKSIT